MQRRLGRLPHDAKRLAALPKHNFGAALAPAVLNRSHQDYVPQMYGNDEYSDCTFAALAHAMMGVSKINGFNLVIAPTLPLQDYDAFLGDPVDLKAADTGANMQDVLDWQAAHGYNIGAESLIGQQHTIDHGDRNALALAMSQFAHVYCGVTLREQDMDDVDAGKPWAVVPHHAGRVVGGHAICFWDYTGLKDTDTVRIATWDEFQPATWAWVHARLDESYALTWPQLAAAPVA